MNAPMVAHERKDVVDTLYRSLVSGEVLRFDQLDECDVCATIGEVRLAWQSAHTGRWVEEVETCDQCLGVGWVEGFGVHGANYAVRRVEPIGETS